jgi:hypothetical protein
VKKRRSRRRRPRRYRFESAAPVVLGRRAAVRPVSIPRSWVLFGVGVVAVAGLAMWFSFSSRFYVQSAEVVGVEWLLSEEVYDASELDQFHILWADADAAQARILERLPSVEQATVSCRLPARCTITVVESPTIATWQGGEELVWVNAVGMTVPATEPLAGAWHVNGPLPVDAEGHVDRDVVDALVDLARLGMTPQTLDYRPGRGLVVQDGAGWRVVLGDGPGMELRLRVYARIRTYLLENDIHPRFVDVRFPQAPYYSEVNEW